MGLTARHANIVEIPVFESGYLVQSVKYSEQPSVRNDQKCTVNLLTVIDKEPPEMQVFFFKDPSSCYVAIFNRVGTFMSPCAVHKKVKLNLSITIQAYMYKFLT